MAAYLGYTLRMKTPCFVADQLWFMTRIQEEEEDWRRFVGSYDAKITKVLLSTQCYHNIHMTYVT